MGIPKLTSYIKKTNLFMQVRNISSIVIDGYALCYKLHLEVESGDYCQFYEKVTDFLSGLNREIEVYVVIDGVDYENRKVETDKRRDAERLQRLRRVDSQVEELSAYDIVISFMAKTVFMDAVRDSLVKFFVADGEADRDVVSLANYLRCPVFGSDSDYFIFNIEGGYIPIDDGRGGLTNLHGVVPCFYYHSFDSAYNLSGSDVRLLIPYCIGNDFHGSNALPELQIERNASVEAVVSKLKGRVMEFDDFQNTVTDDYNFYRVDPHSFEKLSQSRFLSGFNPLVPEWVVMQFKAGQFSQISMRFLASKDTKTWKYTIAIEDVTRESASEVTNTVFPYVAGALLSLERCKAPVRVCRKPKSCDFEPNEVALADKHRNILGSFDLLNIRDCPSEIRETILLQVFHCKSVCKTLRKIPGELKLVVVASRCWLKSIAHDIDHQFKAFILGLVLCFHTSYSRSEVQIPLILNRMGRLRRIHHLAQWECMMHLVIAFNQILGCPFPYTSLGRLFSATVFQNFFTSQPDFLYSKLGKEGRDMYDAITKKLLPDAPVELVRQAQVVRAPRSQAIATQNRFAQLS